MLLPNVAPMLELTYAVPGVGGVLVPLNTRLASPEYAYILEHCGAKVLVAYRRLQKALDPALEELGDDAPRVVWVEEGDAPTPSTRSCSEAPTRSTSSAPTTSAR